MFHFRDRTLTLSRRTGRRAIIVILMLCGLCGCAAPSPQNATVVWISIDGFRGDYLQRYHPPTLERLAREGAFTTQEIPIFPSLTFPNHIAQATGTTVDHHGIPLNDFYDTATRQSYSFPDPDDLIRAEPIWITAKRQGVCVAVMDWPMSHGQLGVFKSDHFFEHYDKQQDDEQRLNRVSEILKSDHTRPPLRLMMTYVSHVDSIGHSNGPDSAEISKTIQETDALIAAFLQSTIDWFNATRGINDELYVLLTTDHGMQPIHTVVNLDRLIGIDLVQGAKIVFSGPVATIYLSDVTSNERQSRAEQIVAKLRQSEFISAWKAADVPAGLHFTDATRIGEVVAALKPGYSFTSQRLAATQPATGTVANHGYDPAVCPTMLGGAIVWRYHHPMGGVDMGPIHNTQWHATVAHLLGIQPAAGADSHVIALPSK